MVARCLDKLGLKEPLQDWSDETIGKVVNAFTDEKFPTVIALNKIDHPDADKVRIVHIINTLDYYVTGLLQMGGSSTSKSATLHSK